jgi:hypothetical protein
MRKPDLSHAIQIVANIGVIAGIVFLAVELHQNNEVLTAQARLQRAQTRIDGLTQTMSNPELMRARFADSSRAELTAEQRALLEISWEVVLTRWQYLYGELQAGLIELEDIPVAGWRRWIRTYPSIYETWQQTKALNYRSDFVSWFDRNVVEPAMAQSSTAVPVNPLAGSAVEGQ